MSTRHTRLVLRAALAAILVAVATHTRADQDLFGNVRFGADVVAARSAVLDDPYSFAGTGRFTNHEWLFQAAAYLAFHAFGGAGLVVLKLSLLAAMIAAVARAVRAAGVEPADRDLLLALTLVTTFPQTNQVRAQLFSLALFAWVLFVLVAARRKPAALFWLAPIMALWPNVHGGWLVGAGTLGVWSGAAVAADRSSRAAWALAGMSVAAVAATVVNPWGWRMWTFLYDTVGFGRADISDWQPVFRLGPAYGALWIVVACLAAAGFAAQRRQRGIDVQSAAVVLMLGAASFRVNRLTSFFALSAVVLAGPDLMVWRARTRIRRPERPPSRLAAGAAAATAIAVLLLAGTISARNASCVRMDDGAFTEPELTALVRERRLSGRMLNWFDYGHYAIWYFTPAITVSIDPRRETAYSDETIQRHLRFYFSPADRQAAIDWFRPDYIWLPSRLPVVSSLVADGWQPLFAGPRSTLLGRPTLNASNPVNPLNFVSPSRSQLAQHAPRCFPGP